MVAVLLVENPYQPTGAHALRQGLELEDLRAAFRQNCTVVITRLGLLLITKGRILDSKYSQKRVCSVEVVL